MPVTKDLGGGIQLVDLGSILESAENIQAKRMERSILSEKIKLLPLEMETQRRELEMKPTLLENQLAKSAIDIEAARLGIIETRQKMANEKSKLMFDQLAKIPGVLGQNFEMGQALLGMSIPGSAAAKNTDGTFTIAIPNPSGQMTTTIIDPNRVADAEKRSEMETTRRKEWVGLGKNFSIQNEFYNNIKGLSEVGTAQADLGIVFSYMKLLDPASSVREGEQATAKNSPGVPERIRNLYNRGLTADAPLFGPVGSDTREKFIGAADILWTNAREQLTQTGRFFVEEAKRSGIDGKNIIVPTGDITYQGILDEINSELAIQSPENIQSGIKEGNEIFKQTTAKAPVAAAFIPQSKKAAIGNKIKFNTKTKEERSKSLDQMLGNMFK
jgi:hypothetical protein